MTRREAKIRALELACGFLHSASISWPMPADHEHDYSDDEHDMISKELDDLAQRCYERAVNLKKKSATVDSRGERSK